MLLIACTHCNEVSLNGNKRKHEVCSTCELIKDSSLWHSNFIPLLRNSIIIIGSGFITLYIQFTFYL